MRKLVAWGFSATLLVGIGVAGVRAGDDEDQVAPQKPAIRWSPYAARVLGIDQSPKPMPKKPAAKSKKDTAKKTEAPPKSAVVVKDDGASSRAREEAALLRRLEACDKLTQIAISRGDNTLLRRAEDLNQRVWAVYSQKTGQAPEPKNDFESDEAAIERLLGPETATRSSQAEAAPPLRYPDRNIRAAAKEVNP
jgi:outer membrane biosynthesis protein TonB